MATAMHPLQIFGFFTGTIEREDWDRQQDFSWKEFFRDPSQWWDNRNTKRSSKQPDFRHKVTKEPLWMDSSDNPSWVEDVLCRRGFAVEECLGPAVGAVAFSPSLIWACSENRDLIKGARLHDELRKRGLLEKNYSDALITMYAKCGEVKKAQTLLDMHNSSSVIPWNTLTTSYARERQGQNALDCFEKMRLEGITPNVVSYMGILKACAVMRALDRGKQIHHEILRQGLLEQSLVLGGALVDMYAKCGALAQAKSVLEKLPSRNVVSWNAMITGYVQKGQGQEALQCYEQMLREGTHPNATTYVCTLKACGLIEALEEGKEIHNEILIQGLLENQGSLENSVVLGGALVDMYAKCGALPAAQCVLETLPFSNVISWSALIAGYVQKEQGQQALICCEHMQNAGISPDAVTYISSLKACGVIGAINKGKQIHNEILRQGLLEHSLELGNALVDMYAKCGALSEAQSVLGTLPCCDTTSWNTLIAGYAQKGHGDHAFTCFQQMQHEGIFPNLVTCCCLLHLCSHLGLMEKGQELFDNMEAMYGLKPDEECFTCMADLFGRAGHLLKAAEVIQEMPFPARFPLWLCLLSSCRTWVNVSVGIWAFERAVELDKCDEAAYILMANIYAEAGMPQKARDIEAMRVKNKLLEAAKDNS